MTRICFLNPFGTDAYDSLIEETVTPSLRPGTELVIRHLVDYPANMDYYVPKHLAEVGVLRAVVAAERDGFDAFVIGCCYDPALTQARELTSMPVIGPLESSVMLARLFGHRFSVVTDHSKAVPELEDRVRVYGLEATVARCRRSTGSSPTWLATPTRSRVTPRAVQSGDREGRSRSGRDRLHDRGGVLRAGGAQRRQRTGGHHGDQPQPDGG